MGLFGYQWKKKKNNAAIADYSGIVLKFDENKQQGDSTMMAVAEGTRDDLLPEVPYLYHMVARARARGAPFANTTSCAYGRT